MTLNKDSHQTILVKKLKNCIIISAALVEIQKIFFRIIAQFQIKNIYLREQQYPICNVSILMHPAKAKFLESILFLKLQNYFAAVLSTRGCSP